MKARIKAIALTAALAFGVTAQASSVDADTLADALVGAYTHSGLLEQNRALLRVADEDVALAAAGLKPILNWRVNFERTFGTSTGASTGLLGGASTVSRSLGGTDVSASLIAELLLWDSGATQARIAAAKEAVLSTRASLLALEQRILLQAVSAFMGVRQASEFVALRQNNLRLLIQELRAAQDRFEVGEVTRTDVSLAEARLAEARSGLASAERDLLQAVEFYRNVVGRRPGRLSRPPALPRTERNVETAKAVAVRRHPDMEAAMRSVAVNDLLLQAAQADIKPTVTLNGSLTLSEELSGSDSLQSGSVGVSVTGPIYNGGRLSSAQRRAQAQRDAARGNLHVVRHDVARAVGDAIADLGAARAQLESSDRQIRAAQVAFNGVREEATLGARTTLDVLDAEQELLNARAARIQAEAQQYVAAYSVLASMGLLTAQQLKLNVQIYDPAAYYELVKDAPTKYSPQGAQLDRVLKALGKE